ncbi:hypothetical protein N8865_01915 [Francisellaceae bacterium]|nr:hypothetical protein [Francisellaceae bacterium]
MNNKYFSKRRVIVLFIWALNFSLIFFWYHLLMMLFFVVAANIGSGMGTLLLKFIPFLVITFPISFTIPIVWKIGWRRNKPISLFIHLFPICWAVFFMLCMWLGLLAISIS